MYTYIPSFLSLPSNPHPAPLGPSWVSYVIQQIPSSYLFYTWHCTHVSPNLLIYPPLHPTPSPHIHFLCCISILANGFICTYCMCVNRIIFLFLIYKYGRTNLTPYQICFFKLYVLLLLLQVKNTAYSLKYT